jgi:hypothetical protein
MVKRDREKLGRREEEKVKDNYKSGRKSRRKK